MVPMNPHLLGPEAMLEDVFGLSNFRGFGEDLPACPVGVYLTSACKCPEGSSYVRSGDHASCVSNELLKSSGGIDWDAVVQVAAQAGVNLAVSATCKWLGVGCPAPPLFNSYPPGYGFEPPWYKTTAGVVAITLGVVGGGVGIYLLARK
jgi:hypothetical protein